MGRVVVTHAERPELADRVDFNVWPAYNTHGDVLNRYWRRLYDDFPGFQFVLYDEDEDVVLGEGHTIPCTWDGTPDGLPAGIDGMMELGFALREQGREPNALSAMAIEIRPAAQGGGLSRAMLEGMRAIGRRHGLGALLAPVRPSWKERYPLTPIGRYARWTREDGLPFDPWIRTHVRLGGEILRPEPRSMRISGTVAEWEDWTEMAFPESGEYVFPHGLAPVAIDREQDLGLYFEPNLWMVHTVE
jgi:GNAT superfamily N-acetyltransferase